MDAARKRECKRAEFALLDTATWTIEFHSIVYDDLASEAKAAAGGYRIDGWTDRFYTLRRRILGRLQGAARSL